MAAQSKARPVVLLDCDGPLADFTQAYLDALRIETGASHSAAEVDRWAIAECDFFRRLSERHSNLKRRVDAHVIKPGFCAGLAVQPGAKAAVELLTELADVYVVTSPWDSSPTWMHERLHWVHKHFGLPRSRVIQGAAKFLIRGDVFVDDKPSHVREWQEAWPHSTGVLFDMHHNRSDRALGLMRAGWPFVIAQVTSLPLAGEEVKR